MSVHKKTFQYGRTCVTHRNRRASPARPTAPSLVTMGDTVVLVTAVGRKKADARPGLLPADRQLRREDLRRRPDPRRLLQARRPADREGDADLAPDRPADPPAVPGRLLQRSAGHRDGAVAEPRDRSGHPRAARRVRRAGAVRHAVQGPDRRRARRLQGRPVPAEPDARRELQDSRSSTSSSPAPQTPC